MSVDIQMIGTGSAFAKRFFNNNAIVRTEDFQLLIDCGITAPLALHQLGVDLTSINAILITHIHADHVGGLEEIAFRMKFIHKSKPVLYIHSQLAGPLWETTLRGGLEDRDSGHNTLADFFDVRLLDDSTPAKLSEQLTVELVPTKHVPGKKSNSVLINETVFYSSDMTFDADLLSQFIASGRCRHILHDCQLRGTPGVHTTLDQLLSLPDSLQKHLWLMHYGDDMESFIGKTGSMRFIEQQKTYTFK